MGIVYGGRLEGDAKLSAGVRADYSTCTDTRRSVSCGAVMISSVFKVRVYGTGRDDSERATIPTISEGVHDTPIKVHEDNSQSRWLRY